MTDQFPDDKVGDSVVGDGSSENEPGRFLSDDFDSYSDESSTWSNTEPRPDVRWVRYRPVVGPLIRWGSVVLVVIVFLVVAWTRIRGWIDDQVRPDGLPGAQVEFIIEDGWTTNDVVAALGDNGVVDNPAMFRQWMRCPSYIQRFLGCKPGGEYSFMAGQYDLREHLTFEETVDLLAAGPVPEEVIRVTIPEGLTLEQTVSRLLQTMPAFDEQELRAALLSEKLRWEYYPDELPFLLVEGLLFPDTYQLDDSTVADELNLINRMHRQFLKIFDMTDAKNRAAALGLTPYEVVIVASLIEEEAMLSVERPKIARVIYNRLNLDWRLGIDATTRYAVGKMAGEELSVIDLEFDSPWNTRLVRGLPPTPISSPGRSSIEAALQPAEGDWLYYVRTDEGGVAGAHTFALTAEEFEKARKVCLEKDLGCG